ncbi:MAG TPA: hypothetical protein PKG54_02560 [Phycisphaerae bacterium]|jgi:N-methylhydantoinase A/oxoprolinase/acetone carboxylase beta subunit|nr:hypothetical protein [Phycisphaerae bacterium]HOB73384.1 hypothetical protein [Phycisphaerae bacterium]HOJ54964.1 hypothetical protein [Phycisphaerae bacterium]HOL25026.1 hypothetical protein [Phycisphaerae bacterium]HPP21327.1 hypothetical protein [Phycisphaerae bacterium]
MSDSRCTYVGLDTGEGLTLLAYWTQPAGAGLEALEATWPVRAAVETFRAIPSRDPAEIQQAIRALCAEHGRRPADCFLVCLGSTRMEAAGQMAAALGMRGLIGPAWPCVLWSEGVLPSQQVREYARPAPEQAINNLCALRQCFAELMEQASEDLQVAQLDQDDSLLDRLIDARYRGRAEVLTLPAESLTDPARLLRPFHAAHAARYGHAHEAAPVEILTVRLRCIVVTFYRPNSDTAHLSAAVTPPPGWGRRVLGGGHIFWAPSQPG